MLSVNFLPPAPLTPPLSKIAVHAPAKDNGRRKEYLYQFLELLRVDRERIIFIDEHKPVGVNQCCAAKLNAEVGPSTSLPNAASCFETVTMV